MRVRLYVCVRVCRDKREQIKCKIDIMGARVKSPFQLSFAFTTLNATKRRTILASVSNSIIAKKKIASLKMLCDLRGNYSEDNEFRHPEMRKNKVILCAS